MTSFHSSPTAPRTAMTSFMIHLQHPYRHDIIQGSQLSYNSHILEKCPILYYIFRVCPICPIFCLLCRIFREKMCFAIDIRCNEWLSSGFKLKDSVLQEWKLYQEETLAEDFFISAKGQRDDCTPYVSHKWIDEYWSSYLKVLIHVVLLSSLSIRGWVN